MKRNKKIAVAVVLIASLAITPLIYYARPLVAYSSLQVTCERAGAEPRAVRVYTMLFRNVVFIETGADCRAGDRWFAIDLEQRVVFCPSWPPAFPYLHFRHDMNLGVRVDDDVKRNGDWQVSWSGSEATWTNGEVTMRLTGA